MSFLRTVLGDIPADTAGICYAHEHLIIDHSFVTFTNPEFLLDSVDAACVDLAEFVRAGGKTLIDSMPCGGGRNVRKLAEIALRTGTNIVCPTGVHLALYYAPGHWGGRLSAEQLANVFIQEIEQGIDYADLNGPTIDRSPHRAGLIKVASSLNQIDARERRIMQAAAIAHHATGAPILTHSEQGTAALDQVRVFQDHGVPLQHVVISHTDRKPDCGYHRELFSTGVMLEYDSAFRWPKGGENHTLELVMCAAREGALGQVVLGMDAARRKYWHGYGGAPGMDFLLREFIPILIERGLTRADIDRIFIENPAAAYSFQQTDKNGKERL
jgi:phosphotriesterase-related protein